jgi:restriction system protein
MSTSTPPASEPHYYLVRSNPDLVEQGLVGVGWSDFNFAEIAEPDEAIDQINNAYGVGRNANQIRRFFNIAPDDVIVAPLPYSVAIGRATGGLVYSEAHFKNDEANQRRVSFPRDAEAHVVTVPRSSFSEAFQRRLRVRGMTVNDLSEFADEIQEALVSLARGENHHWQNHFLRQVSQQREQFKSKLLDNIQSGRTNLLTGGAGLENLVRELLTIEGYKARVLSKQQFGSFADADVLATRTDRIASVQLLVQVKHHQGQTGAYGVHQLQEIAKAHAGEYNDHKRVMITSGAISPELATEAENAGVTVIGGTELVDWIAEHIDRLASETKFALGIYEVPAVL